MNLTFKPTGSYSPIWAGLECYCMDKSTAYNVLEFMTTPDFVTGVSKLFVDPSDYVAGIRIYPFDVVDPHTTVTKTSMRVGGVPFVDVSDIAKPNLLVYSLNPVDIDGFYSAVLNAGDIYVPLQVYAGPGEYDFRNFAPFTSVKFWVPFVGFVDADPGLVMGKTVHLRYQIDYSTGSSVWVVYAGDADNCVVIATGEVTLGINVPVGRNNAASAMLNGLVGTIASVASVAGAASTGGASAAIGAVQAVGSGISAAQGFHISGSAGSATGGIGDLYSDLVFTCQIERVNADYPSNYGHMHGFPCMMTYRLSALTGYTKVARVHPEGIPCTAQELQEIEQKLLAGVIL